MDLKNIGINSCGLDIGKRGGTQGRWLTHANKNSQGLVLTKETVIPVKVITR